MADRELPDVIQEIMAERSKQQSYGFDAAHDDKYEADELLRASICYASDIGKGTTLKWPWCSSWWKPRNRRCNLIRAIALLVAYVESTDRRTGSKEW